MDRSAQDSLCNCTGAQSGTLPEIRLPEALQAERKRSILGFLKSTAGVSCFHVLGRSGTLAATGIYENSAVASAFNLPPLIPIDGIGNELWNAFCQELYDAGRDDEVPGCELGEFGEEEDRQLFYEWVARVPYPQVADTIAQLRMISPHQRKIGLLDDVRQSGNVALGIAPALYKAAYGDQFTYNPADNHYLFHSADWLDQVIDHSFAELGVNPRQRKFLREVAKGDTDWVGFDRLKGSNPAEALLRLAHYHATAYLGYSEAQFSGETVLPLLQEFGDALLELHDRVRQALLNHTQAVLGEM